MFFQNFDLQKRWLDKSLKSTVLEDSSDSNMVNGLKHCGILGDNSLTIFIDHCESNWVGKCLF